MFKIKVLKILICRPNITLTEYNHDVNNLPSHFLLNISLSLPSFPSLSKFLSFWYNGIIKEIVISSKQLHNSTSCFFFKKKKETCFSRVITWKEYILYISQNTYVFSPPTHFIIIAVC